MHHDKVLLGVGHVYRKYVFFTGFQLRRIQNESPVLPSLLSGLPEWTGQNPLRAL